MNMSELKEEFCKIVGGPLRTLVPAKPAIEIRRDETRDQWRSGKSRPST